MLRVGRDRLTDAGQIVPAAVCDAERLPFPTGYFDRVSVAFGLRNMTHKDRALAEMTQVLKPGGKLLVLEFSRIAKPLAPVYDWYSFNVLPWLGKTVARDEASYRYMAESIRMHPDQETLADMMRTAGLERVQYFNLTAGIAALHEVCAWADTPLFSDDPLPTGNLWGGICPLFLCNSDCCKENSRVRRYGAPPSRVRTHQP